MSHRNYYHLHHHKERTEQAKLLAKVENVQRRQHPFRSQRPENYAENNVGITLNANQNEGAFTNPRDSESYDIIRYDEPTAPPAPERAEYFNELYGQEENSGVVERRATGGKTTTQRSRSLPPSSEINNRLAANFPYDDGPVFSSQSAVNEDTGEYSQFRHENLLKKSPSCQYVVDEEAPPFRRSRSPTKKMQYAQQSQGGEKFVSNKRASSPVQSRFRSDCVETEGSDMTLAVPRGSRPQSPLGNRIYSSQPPPPLRTLSDRSFHSMEDFENRNHNNNNNYRGGDRYSQDSLVGFGSGMSNSIYGQDVLPLPIEIPDNVADAEAFRRYLSVRRGAITPVRQQNISLAKRNQSCPSYESIGRRPPRQSSMAAAIDLASRGHIEQEARRRTSSLSHAIMTLALLSASICQLRFLITYSHAHAYPILNYFLVFTSIILEVAAGVGYVLIARCSYDDVHAESVHNYLIFALFIVAISNVILAAFAFDDHLCDELKWRQNRVPASSSASQDQQFIQPRERADNRVMDLRYMPLE